ncbi:MAG TPA: hypothetical protein DEB18_16485 [Leeuwenhoekiella sp.]|nr:hypothetical protein [Leeuwenhoekiella sp.]
MKVNKKKFIQIIKEETEKILKEAKGASDPANLDKKLIIAAAAAFAESQVKGKENEQIPTALVSNTTMEEGDRFLKGGRAGQPAKIKRSKTGTTFRKVRVGAKWDYDNYRVIKSLIKSKENDMNKKIRAVKSCLMYGKGTYNVLDSKNEFVNTIIRYAREFGTAPKGKYTIKRFYKIGMETDVAADSHIESSFLTRDHAIRNKETVDGKTVKDEKFGGSKVESFMLCTAVEYLTGPLASTQPGQYAGIKDKMAQVHDTYVRGFGSKSALGAIRSVGMGGIEDQSSGEFDRKLAKAMEGSEEHDQAAVDAAAETRMSLKKGAPRRLATSEPQQKDRDRA